jgi:hypothetical protein
MRYFTVSSIFLVWPEKVIEYVSLRRFAFTLFLCLCAFKREREREINGVIKIRERRRVWRTGLRASQRERF